MELVYWRCPKAERTGVAGLARPHASRGCAAEILADEVSTDRLDSHSKLTAAHGVTNNLVDQTHRVNRLVAECCKGDAGMKVKRQTALG